jgi:hypothetical protein
MSPNPSFHRPVAASRARPVNSDVDVRTHSYRGRHCGMSVPTGSRIRYSQRPHHTRPCMKHVRAFVLLIWAALVSGCAAGPDRSPEAQLIAIAESWLQLVDSRQFEEAWNNASPHVQRTTPLADFTLRSQEFRSPLGTVAKRETLSRTFSVQARGRPDGQYFHVIFQTSFQNRRARLFEHVTLESTPTGWKVADYFLR